MQGIVSVHVGQAGVNLGESQWDLFRKEHGIEADGTTTTKDQTTIDHGYRDFLFSENANGSYTARAVFCDTEKDIIHRACVKGSIRGIVSHSSMITGKEDAANNFIRGKYTIGRELRDRTDDAIRRHAEGCDQLQGFMMYFSLGGGTGSGHGTSLLEHVASTYRNVPIYCVNIAPSESLGCAPTETYNTILALHEILSQRDTTRSFFMDNEGLYAHPYTQETFTQKGDDNPPLSFATINPVVANVVSTLTAPCRFNGLVTQEFSSFDTVAGANPLLLPALVWNANTPSDLIKKDNKEEVQNSHFLCSRISMDSPATTASHVFRNVPYPNVVSLMKSKEFEDTLTASYRATRSCASVLSPQEANAIPRIASLIETNGVRGKLEHLTHK
eukprot:PhF_6_TR37622/c0_g1_i2/m.55941/K07374/TUBA; tubulin alpha